MQIKHWFIIIISLIACANGFAATQNLIIALDWFINPDHAPLFVAQQMNYFAEQGLNVSFVTPKSPDEVADLVADNKADIGVDSEPSLVEQVANKNFPLVRFGTLIDQPLKCLVTLTSSPYKNLPSLKNQTIVYSGLDVESALLQTMLKKDNLSLNNIKLVNVNYGLVPALVNHQAAAAMGMMRNYELLQLDLMKQPGHAFYPENYGIPNYDELIFITNKNKINEQKLRKFLVAEQEGLSYLQSHPVETWLMFIKKYPKLNTQLNQYAWFESIHYFTNDPAYLNTDKYNQFMHFMYEHHLINKKLPLNDYAVNLLMSA